MRVRLPCLLEEWPQRLPSGNPSRMLAQLEAAILSRDMATMRNIVDQLDLMSANECLRQLGKEWGFPTVEVQGQRIMLMRDLAQLVYGYGGGAVSNLIKILARFGRKPLYLQRYSRKYQEPIRAAFGLGPTTTSAAFATWADLLIVGMRGHTAGAKRLQAYLMRAERENRIHWTMEQLRGGQVLSKVWAMLQDRDLQINWVKKRNDRVIREGGMARFFQTWHETFLSHTDRSGRKWEQRGEAERLRFSKKRGQHQSGLQVVRHFMPEAGASISMESELHARGFELEPVRDLRVRYIKPFASELKKLDPRVIMGEEAEFWRAIDEGI
jgi:hypothetical protein